MILLLVILQLSQFVDEQVSTEEIILVVDNCDNSRLLLHELLFNCSSYFADEDGRWISHVQETMKDNVIIVNYAEIKKMENYKLMPPKSYPAVRIGRYKDYHYFPDISFGSSYYSLLSLKKVVDEELRSKDMENWEIFCKNLNRKENNYHWDAMCFLRDNKISDVFEGLSLEECEKLGKGHIGFPKKPVIEYPPRPSQILFPWQEGYSITEIKLFRSKTLQP